MRKKIILLTSLLLLFSLVGCGSGEKSDFDNNSNIDTEAEPTVVETKPLNPYEAFYGLKPSLESEIYELYLYQLDLSDDSIREKRSVEIAADEELNRISVVMDLAINRGLFDDVYGANSSVNAPQLFCDSVRDEAIGAILGIFRKNLDEKNEPSKGFDITILWNVYDKFEDDFGGFEYRLVRKYGKDRVGISRDNWKKIQFDEFFKTNAKPIALSDLFKPTKNSYPRGRCLWEP